MATQNRSSLLRFQLEGVEGPGEEIGRGSYAVVEEYDFQGLSCVGKTIHQELYDCASTRDRETMLERFEGESEMLSRLHHPNIVQFLGVHINEGSPLPVLLMERLHSTLAVCVDRYGKLPDECCYSVLRDVGVGLRYLHGHVPNPIVHRDLTANNVLLTPDLTAKISDLGVAKIINLNPTRMTQMTKCPGTPSYMPPEALIARPIYSAKMDIFAYGNLMTHVFCGQWPIPAEIFRANPSNPHDMAALTEVQRREEYLNDIGDTHPLMGLMRECLSNNPTIRPNIPEILSRVKEVMPQFPPSFETKAEVLQRIDADATDRASLNAQISNLCTQVEQKEDQLCTILNENAALDDQRKDLLTQIEQKVGKLQALTNENVTLHDQVRDQKGELCKLSDENADRFTKFSAQVKQKEDQLQALSAQLEQLQKITVEETETLNATHGMEIERLNVRLDELRAEAKGLRAAVTAKEKRLSAREQEIEATQEIVKARDLAVAAKEQQRKEEVAAIQQEIEAAQMIIKAREQELALKDLAVAAKEQQRKEEVAAKEQEIEAAETIIKAKEQEMVSKDLAIAAKEQQQKEEIEAIQAIIRSKEKQLALNIQVAATNEQQRKQEIEANSRLLNAKDEDISSLRMEVASKDATLQAKDSTIASLTASGETLLQRNQTLTDENAALNKRMATLSIDSAAVPVQGQMSEVDSVSGGGSQSVFAELESQVFALKSEAAKMESTERQLMDRNAALEEQLSESMGAVKDQSKLNVSQLQQDREELVMRYEAQLLELQEQLKMATKERDSLLANRERVTAQWEGRIRRLEQQLKAYQEGNTPAEVDSVSGGGSQSVFAELESQVSALKSEAAKMENTERQLMDRNAALEEQLSESMGAVKDQSKLNVSQLQQDREELVMRYEAQLLELQEQLEMATKERDSLLANRERVTAQWEGRIRRLEQQLKAYQEGKTPAEQAQLELELETMRQKCNAWRQEGEKLLPLRNEMQQLQAHISEIEEQCERLRLDNNGLGKRLLLVLEESKRRQAEMTRKGTDYDILMHRFTELQQICATLENELGPLREEREALQRENTAQSKAQLLELRKQLESVIKERDSLRVNHKKVTAQWEGRIQTLEQQLKVYQQRKTTAKLKSGYIPNIEVEKPLGSASSTIVNTSTVQFMWQPLTEITYPKIALIASFECGSVELWLDPEGSYYASRHVTIKKGTYEGQLVIGDGFINPVKNFTVEKDDNTVILQFKVSREEGRGEQGGHYGDSQYGSGYMQRNPSYGSYSNQGYQGTGSHGYGTSGGGDTRYGGGDMRYGGVTRYGGGDMRYGGGDTHYGTSVGGGNSGGGDTRYGTSGGGDTRYYDRHYGTSSGSGEKYSSHDGLPIIDFEYHPQYPTTYNQPRNSPVGEASTSAHDHAFSQAPVMQESAGHASPHNTFSRQLSAEGFGPVQVKSKGDV